MNKLEERFEELISVPNVNSYIEVDTVYNCTKEVKEIAIEFNNYCLDYYKNVWKKDVVEKLNHDQLFTRFINQKYE